MQFKVPQFLEIEDKLFGPFTFRQFVYMAGGAGVCFVFYRLLGLFWGIIPIVIFGGFALALAFYRPNNKPFIGMVESAFKYALQSKLYVWKKREVVKGSQDLAAKNKPDNSQNYQTYQEARLTGDKLRDLAWSLDVLDLSQHRTDAQTAQEKKE